jgi:NAD(P)-dependent dehydrogenase (short-subunit alcohol dehydrogenase family)
MTHSEEKVAVITGASQGIGAGLTTAYRELGYVVIANARSIGPSADSGIVTIEGDIADPDTAQRVVEEAVERFGRIDTLINNAGVYIGKPFTDYTLEDFNALVTVNLAGFFHMTTRTIKRMLDQGEVEDVVGGVLYLESAPFVTGEILHIDGGQSAGH